MSSRSISVALIAGILIVSTGNTATAQPNKSDEILLSIEYESKNESKGLSIQAPKGWSFMSPSEVRKKTRGAFKIAANAIFFVVNKSDFDSNINVQYIGDASREAPNVGAATRLLTQMQRQAESSMRQQLTGFSKVKAEIIDFAGGVALDFVFTSKRGNTSMKQKQILVISNKKAFTITCTAKESDFNHYFSTGFEPILKSIKIR
jgi:hypothetical protein